MIDLMRVFKREAPKQGIAFIAVSKTVAADAAKAYVEKAGFNIESPVEQDAGTVFVQPGFAAEDHVVLYRVNDDVVVGLATPNLEAIQKGYETYNWQSTSFKEVLATEQTVPLFHIAKEALCDTFYNLLNKAETPQEFQSGISAMLADFTAHVNDVVRQVPVAAFKLETAIDAALTVEKTEDQGKVGDAEVKPDDKADTVEKTEEAPAKKPEDETTVEKTEEKTEDAPAGTTEEAPKAEVEKTDEPKGDDQPPAWAAGILSAVEDVKSTVASVSTEVGEVRKQVGTLGSDLEATKASIAKMDDALGTGIVGGTTTDDGKATTIKSAGGTTASGDDGDDEAGFAHFDTAFGDPFKEAKAA
jgi:hypothetical protein